MADKEEQGSVLPCSNIKSRDWHAWIDMMPPGPNHLHVVGEVYVPNPGINPILVPREPQGINPRILLLDLLLIQSPGMWPQVFVWKQARYDKIVQGNQYDRVTIFCGESAIADIEVKIVQ